ncbi:hypothetical protein BJY04DRAFT_222518 [Aspergillus karnatakaensis]|uniref:BTB/POZ domain-containing protein n=1 Tax=Aspergillus karnatakaensis TaxID=1810916 RepID=UPI003CCDD609
MGTRVIVPDGDLTIECSGACYLASSKALCAISPFFRAYTYVTRVLASGRSKPPVLSVPDDPDIFCIFLNMAHSCPVTLSWHYKPDILRRVADLVEKYRTKTAMVRYAREWLRRDLSGLSPEDLWSILRFSHAFAIMAKVEATMPMLIQTCSVPFESWEFAKENLGRFPGTVLANLDNQQRRLKSRTTEALLSIPNALSEYDCVNAQIYTGAYVQSLIKLDILPGTGGYSQKTYQQIARAAAQLPEEIYTSHEGCKCAACNGLEQKAYLANQLAGCLECLGFLTV